ATSAVTYTFTGLTSGTYQCKVRVTDNAGNTTISNVVSMTTQSVGTIILTPSTTNWTNQNVTVTIAYPTELTTKEYSTNGGSTWTTYTAAVVISANGTVLARGNDAAGNQAMQASLTVSNIDKTAPNITNLTVGGTLYTDPTFVSGINSTNVYNNTGNGLVTNTRVTISGSPTGSSYGLEIKTTGNVTPGWGGFYFATPSGPNKVFITKIIAKIPVGYNINFASNSIGTGGYYEWLTSQAGTGNWQEYVAKATCGSTGTFSTTNFYYLTDGATPSVSSPLIWQVAYATVYDTNSSAQSNNIVISATDDTSKIVGYGINQSNTIQPTYTACSETLNFSTVFNNISAGTYYIWVKDKAGNVKVSNAITVAVQTSYGTSIQSSYANIYSTHVIGGPVRTSWSAGTYAGNYVVSAWSPDGYSGALTSLITPDGGEVKYINSGTNTYNLNTISSTNRWVTVRFSAAYLTGTADISGFKLVFNDNNSYTLDQAVSSGYIEPLVIIVSGYYQNGVPYYWPSILNIKSGASLGARSYASAQIIFKVKNMPLKAITMYSSVNFYRPNDGLKVDQMSAGFEYSLTPLN
ncbi:MAG: hypothetical protein N2749_02325, partial [Clostridia bacterium]|nr:hypothetical protein [Clostridia bacterium]